MPGNVNGGPLDLAGSRKAYKHLRTEGSTLSHSDLCTNSETNFNTSTVRQHNSSSLSNENGRDQKLRVDKSQSRDLELFIGQTDHDYFRIPTRGLEHNSRHRISGNERFQRVETKQKNISKNSFNVRLARDRPICITSVTSTPNLHLLETGPSQSKSGCLSEQMDLSTKLCISSILPNREGLRKSSEGAKLFDLNNSRVASPTLVSKIITNECGVSDLTSNISKSLDKPFRKSTSLDREQNIKVSGLASFRKGLEAKGISERASSLISSSRRRSTTSHYESSWRKWICWCDRREIDTIECDLSHVLDFLASLFDEGLEYNTICSYRSAISAYHAPIEGVVIGKQPLIHSLIAGIFNRRPPKPKYTFIWDVEQVLTYIKSLPLDNSICMKDLTQKLTTLLALVAASRASEICSLDINLMGKSPSCYVFTLSKLAKTERQSKLSKDLKFDFFPEDVSLCVELLIYTLIELRIGDRGITRHNFY